MPEEQYRCSSCNNNITRDDLEEYAYDHEDGRIYICPECEADIHLEDDELKEDS